jgi:hypothetical protein
VTPSATLTRAARPPLDGQPKLTRQAINAAKYADQSNFVPFIVETGGYISRRTHLFLDSLRGSQGSTPGPRGTSGERHPKTHVLDTLTAPEPGYQANKCTAKTTTRPTCYRGLWQRSALQTSFVELEPSSYGSNTMVSWYVRTYVRTYVHVYCGFFDADNAHEFPSKSYLVSPLHLTDECSSCYGHTMVWPQCLTYART